VRLQQREAAEPPIVHHPHPREHGVDVGRDRGHFLRRVGWRDERGVRAPIPVGRLACQRVEDALAERLILGRGRRRGELRLEHAGKIADELVQVDLGVRATVHQPHGAVGEPDAPGVARPARPRHVPERERLVRRRRLRPRDPVVAGGRIGAGEEAYAVERLVAEDRWLQLLQRAEDDD
jgi:hypothetical protein